jgi:hypothetical protein
MRGEGHEKGVAERDEHGHRCWRARLLDCQTPRQDCQSEQDGRGPPEARNVGQRNKATWQPADAWRPLARARNDLLLHVSAELSIG